MFRDILIVFENQQICQEAVVYGLELAKRMDAGVALIMLARMRFLDRSRLGVKRSALSRIEESAARMLHDASAAFIKAGIEVSTAFRVGEPAQELLKYLADREPFQAIIWGSGLDLPGKGHWVWRTSGAMECPLLAVTRKQ